MYWRKYFELSHEAVELEQKLKPMLRTHLGTLKSTAQTDVEQGIIMLDISQPPLKCALSYAYELKNYEHRLDYQQLNDLAHRRAISKVQYVKSITRLEARAAMFRCRVFTDLGAPLTDLTFHRDYLEIYKKYQNDEDKCIDMLALYIQEQGLVRREYSAKKYYAACFDYYAG